jgi:hypothetical protein
VKRISALGMIIVASISASAFASAPSAMASDTALCLIHQTPCAVGNQVKRVHWVSTSANLLSSLANITCTKKLLVWEVLALGAPQLAHVIESVIGGCETSTKVACTATSGLALYDILKTALNLARATPLGGELKFICGKTLSCTFGGEPELHIWGTGGLEEAEIFLPTLTALKVKLTVLGGEICPKEAFWDVTYLALENFWVTS